VKYCAPALWLGNTSISPEIIKCMPLPCLSLVRGPLRIRLRGLLQHRRRVRRWRLAPLPAALKGSDRQRVTSRRPLAFAQQRLSDEVDEEAVANNVSPSSAMLPRRTSRGLQERCLSIPMPFLRYNHNSNQLCQDPRRFIFQILHMNGFFPRNRFRYPSSSPRRL
jgi:hypothetical protein